MSAWKDVQVLFLVSFLARDPSQDDGSIVDGNCTKIADWRWEADGSLFVTEDDLANVGKTLFEICSCTLLVDCLK